MGFSGATEGLRMDSQMDVTDNGEGSQEVPEGLTQATSAGEESAGEAPAPEAPAAMATDEGRSTAEAWLQQISKHLHHVEGRLMEEGFLGHEVVRQIGILLERSALRLAVSLAGS